MARSKKKITEPALEETVTVTEELTLAPTPSEAPVEETPSAEEDGIPIVKVKRARTPRRVVPVEVPVVEEYLGNKIRAAFPKLTAPQVNRAVEVHQRGGTVGVEPTTGYVVYLPSKAPSAGGKAVLQRSRRGLLFVSDL